MQVRISRSSGLGEQKTVSPHTSAQARGSGRNLQKCVDRHEATQITGASPNDGLRNELAGFETRVRGPENFPGVCLADYRLSDDNLD